MLPRAPNPYPVSFPPHALGVQSYLFNLPSRSRQSLVDQRKGSDHEALALNPARQVLINHVITPCSGRHLPSQCLTPTARNARQRVWYHAKRKRLLQRYRRSFCFYKNRHHFFSLRFFSLRSFSLVGVPRVFRVGYSHDPSPHETTTLHTSPHTQPTHADAHRR